MSVDMYEQDVTTLVEDAMACGKAGGVVTSVQMLHATPGAFVTHSNNRRNKDQLRRSFRQVSPTFGSGVCGGGYYPFEEDVNSMRNGTLSRQWTLFEQKRNVSKEVSLATTYTESLDFSLALRTLTVCVFFSPWLS